MAKVSLLSRRARARGLALIFLVLAAPPGCKKSPISPDAALLDRPIIWLNATEIAFSAAEAAPHPAPQELSIKNSGKGTLKYTISDDAAWLSVDPADGTSAGQANAHAVSVDASGLAAQDASYTATITISCQDAYNNPQKVSVTLKVVKEPPPEISVTPASLTFAGQAGGSNPTPQNILINNGGQGVLSYTITKDAAWLEVNPTTGSSSGESRSHAVTVNTAGLAEGNYSATITVADPKAANSPQRVSVVLHVSQQPPPTIVVSRSSLSFSAQAGGANPSPQTIGIRNGGSGTLTYTVAWDAPWLSVAPTGGSSTGQENAHTVSVNIGGLSQGSYTGTITISSPGAVNSPQVIAVTLQVTTVSTRNAISVSCSPAQAYAGASVTFPIAVDGNIRDIAAFGLQLTFDTGMFQYVGTTKGGLTANWGYVDGNESSGTVTVGGFAMSGTNIAVGSSGVIAVVTLRVTGGSYSNGQQSVVTIRAYADDISGMQPEPATTTFTLRK
jgi:hypothetical protein